MKAERIKYHLYKGKNEREEKSSKTPDVCDPALGGRSGGFFDQRQIKCFAQRFHERFILTNGFTGAVG